MAKFLLVFLFFHLASSKPLNETITKELFSKCGAKKCSTIEAPLCIRVKSQYNGTMKSFHIMVFNKCEMQYFKCHQGMEATIVPMKKCGHGSHQPQAAKPRKRSKRELPAAGVKKRMKRDASAVRSKKKNNTLRSHSEDDDSFINYEAYGQNPIYELKTVKSRKNNTRRRPYYSDDDDSFINYEAYGQNTIYELKKNSSKPAALHMLSGKNNVPNKKKKEFKARWHSIKKAKQVKEEYQYSEGMDYGKGIEYGAQEGGSEYANKGDYDMSDERVQYYTDNDNKPGKKDDVGSYGDKKKDDDFGSYGGKNKDDDFGNYGDKQKDHEYPGTTNDNGNHPDDGIYQDRGFDDSIHRDDTYGGNDGGNYDGGYDFLQGKGKGSEVNHYKSRNYKKNRVIVKDLKKFDEDAAQFSKDIDEFLIDNYKVGENVGVKQKAQQDDIPDGAVNDDDDDAVPQQSPENPQLDMPPPGGGPVKLNILEGQEEMYWTSEDYDHVSHRPSGKATGYKSQDQGSKMGLVKELEKGNWKQFTDDCPTECPVRDRMVCARCVHNVYRTFMSTCHMRMYACHDRADKLELITRLPCAISAPYFYDLPDVTHRLSEPHDDDRVLRFIYCRMKGLGENNADPVFEITNTRCKME